MTEAALCSQLEEILKPEANSFIRYVVEASESTPRDAFDHTVFRLYQDWYRETEQNRKAILDLLAEAGYFPQAGTWPLTYSQFNYLAPSYLLSTVIRLMAQRLEAIRAKSAELEGWPRARDLVRAIIEREEFYLERARALQAERPQAGSRLPRSKGTSAARW